MKFLVIDDHVLIRQAMNGVLKKLKRDAVVLEASNWESATTIVASNPNIDLIILDLTLPDYDGFAALSELRERHPKMSIVVVSALQDRAHVMQALDLGALGYIPKSAEADVMLIALRLVLSGGIYIPPQILTDHETAAPELPESDRQGVSLAGLQLTNRQREVLELVMQGMSNKTICRKLNLAEPTVKNHVTKILKALNVNSRTEAVVALNELRLRQSDTAKQ
jgi:DNA-binding NarL/FixJ family response regulator